MNKVFVKCKESVIDQYGKVRVNEGVAYELLKISENSDKYLITGELNEKFYLGSEYFEEVEEL